MNVEEIQKKYGIESVQNDANVDEAAFENVAGEIGPIVSRCSVLSNKIQELESGIKNLKTLKSQLKGYVGQIEAKVAKLNPATRKRLKTFLNDTIRNVPKIKGL